MMVERYSNLKEEVGGSNPNREISSLLDMNLSSGSLALVLWRWHVGAYVLKEQKKHITNSHHPPLFLDAISKIDKSQMVAFYPTSPLLLGYETRK